MGVDDVLCVLLFLVFAIKSIILKKGKNIKFGHGFWIVSLFVVVEFVSDTNGMIIGGRDSFTNLKPVLKALIYWGLFFCVLNSIENEKDYKRQMIFFSTACALGGITVLIQYFDPEMGKIFTAPASIKNFELYKGMRASGSFMNPNGAACLLSASIPIIIATIDISKGMTKKIIFMSLAVFTIVALYATQSRSGLLAGAIGILLLLSRSKLRAWALLLIAAIIITGILFAGARESYRQRMIQTYSSKEEKYDKNILGRIDTWKSYLYTATPIIYLFGQGFDHGVESNGMESHNAYISLLTVYGIGGVVWFLWLVVGMIRAKRKLYSADRSLKTSMNALLIAFGIWCAYGLASDSISSLYPRYLLFFTVCMVDRIHHLSSSVAQGVKAIEHVFEPQQKQYHTIAV
jgi:O-antigen ligase